MFSSSTSRPGPAMPPSGFNLTSQIKLAITLAGVLLLLLSPGLALADTINVAGTGTDGLSIRDKPSTDGTRIAVLPEGSTIPATCFVYGQRISGTPVWWKTDQGYVSSAFDSTHYASDQDIVDRYGVGPCSSSSSTSTRTSPPPSDTQTLQPAAEAQALQPTAAPPAGSAPSTPTEDVPGANGDDTCQTYQGQRIADSGSVSGSLFGHYLRGHGASVVIDWSFFANNASFVAKAKSLAVGEFVQGWAPPKNSDMYFGLGHFTIVRDSEDCFLVYDRYDFNQRSVYAALHAASTAGAASEFDVHASGKL